MGKAVSIELYYIILGIKVAITGKRVRMIKQNIIAPTKGQLPLKIVLSGISHTPASAERSDEYTAYQINRLYSRIQAFFPTLNAFTS